MAQEPSKIAEIIDVRLTTEELEGLSGAEVKELQTLKIAEAVLGGHQVDTANLSYDAQLLNKELSEAGFTPSFTGEEGAMYVGVEPKETEFKNLGEDAPLKAIVEPYSIKEVERPGQPTTIEISFYAPDMEVSQIASAFAELSSRYDEESLIKANVRINVNEPVDYEGGRGYSTTEKVDANTVINYTKNPYEGAKAFHENYHNPPQIDWNANFDQEVPDGTISHNTLEDTGLTQDSQIVAQADSPQGASLPEAQAQVELDRQRELEQQQQLQLQQQMAMNADMNNAPQLSQNMS